MVLYSINNKDIVRTENEN